MSTIYIQNGQSSTEDLHVHDSMYVFSGGTAYHVWIYSGGEMYISADGVANYTKFIDMGDMYVYSGGIANNTTVCSGGYMAIAGTANSTTVAIGGYMVIKSGGVANSTIVDNGTLAWGVAIAAGGEGRNTTVKSDGGMTISQNGKHTGTLQIDDGAYVSTYKGIIDFTVADRTVEDDYLINNLSVISGTPTYTITVSAEQSDGTYKLAQGAGSFTGSITIGDGTTSYGSITVNGEDFIYNDTTYSLDQVNGNLTLSIEKIPPSVFIYSSGTLTSSGTVIDNAILASGGNNSMHISSGGVANSTTVNSGGDMDISSGGAANNTTVNSGGYMYISSGGVANSTTVNSSGWMSIFSDGVANSTTVNSYGYMRIRSGGVANSTTVSSGGGMIISYDGKHTGSLQIANGASVSVKQSGVIDFTIADRTANDGYLINNLSLISGTPTYTITVLENQVFGEYKLAQGAGNFSSSISIGDGTTSYGSITVNGDVFKYNGVDYQLTQQNGNLHLSIGDFTPPAAPTYTVSNTALTNQNVTVSAVFSLDSVIKQYSLNGKDWQTYTDGIVFTENGTVSFRAQDAAGNISDVTTYEVTNIDKVAPTLDISADKTAPTNQNVVLTATVSDGTVEYYDGKNWVAGSTFEVTANGTYQFRVTDAAGNSVTDSIVVNNIDKVAPTLDISADKTAPTNQNVVLTATVSDGTVEYFANGKWNTGNSLTVTENGTYQFRVTDAAGNSVTDSIVVNNIDKVAPTLDISADKTAPTNQNVVLTATVSDGTVEYYDGKNWVAGSTFEVSANGTYQFRVTDAAGNSVTDSIVVNNIDKVAPTLEVSGNVTEWTNNDVVLSATASDGTIEYFDGENWVAGSTLTVTQNGTYQFRVTDLAGNITETSVVVDKIDKTAPDNPVASADIISQTRENVTVTATFAEDSVKNEYSLDGKIWNVYTEGIVFDVNGTVYFRSTDHVGNISETVFEVTNIDKVAPTLDITADKTAPTNQNVVLTATVSDGTVEYYDGKNWVAGSIFEVSANGTYQFRVTDEAGNSVTDSIIVSNIDKVAPTLYITADKTAPTNQNVVLTATVSDGTVEYFANGKWNAGNSLTVTENGTYQFRVTDAAGNSVTDSIIVSNIDKVAPTLYITADKTTPTNQNVVLTATVSDGTVEYFANGKWNVGTSLTVTENGTYQFRVTDAAGNSVTDSIIVSNIDKVAPTLDISADKTAPTNQNVVLTATVSDGTVEYFANGKWNTGNSLTVTENGTYQFRVTDAAGNSVTDSIIVSNIDKVAPTLEISGNATDWTNKNVILKATVSDGRVEHFDGEFWVSGSTFEVSANGTYQFRVTDAAGNVTQKSVTVNKIDKIAPDKPVAKADITSVTTGNVTVSATFAEDSVRNEYSFNVRTWLTYSREIVFDENGTVYFRSTDAAGNVSAIAKYAVTNIDRVGPDKPVASADILELTNQNVTVSAVFSNDSAIKQYSFDGQNWQTYTQGVVFEQNGTIYFRSYDASGNVSPTASYEVANIDKVAPTLEISGNAAEWTNEDVVLTAAVSDGTVEYFANGKWNAGTVFTAVENGTYQFRVTDTAGNVTQKSVVVDKIDKTAPVIDNVAADITEITHFDVKVTADFSDNNGFTAQYKINDGDWIDYLDGVIMSENGTVYFKAADEAGNETYAEYTVSNIDKLAPDMPIVTFWERGYISNDPIIVSAVFAENSALKQYSFNGVDWFEYTDALYVRTSGEVFFRSCDIAGNYSAVATAVVKEIDDTADSALTEYIFVNAKYSEKNTRNKEQNGIPLVYGENAFNTLYDFKHSADEKIVMLDAAVNIFNNTDLTDIGTMAANVFLPKKKMTVNNYSYSAQSSVRGKLNINGKDTGSVIFENFATVNLSNSAHVNSIEGGKASSTYTVKTSYKQGVKNETVTHKVTKSASGKAVLSSASADVLSNYSSVTLDGSSVGKIENNAYKLTETVKTVGSAVVNSKRTEQFSAGGTVILKNNSAVDSVKNYKTVKITDSKAGAISNFAVAKIVNGSETRKVSGSVTLVRAEADTIENYSKVTMTDSHIGNALNVQRVTASKGFNTLEKFVGTLENDTLTIGKNAVLVLNGADFGEGKDKFVNSGTLIFGSDFEINAETLSGKGNFAATSEVYEKLSGKVSGLLNLGQTYEGFRNTQYELADNTEKKAVKWDMKSDYNGWLNSDIGFEDTVDFIKFKAKENSVIKISGEFSGGTDKITLNGSVLTADADGNYIAMVSAKTDYILKLERNEMNSVNYEISLIA